MEEMVPVRSSAVLERRAIIVVENGTLTPKESMHNVYMFSASTEKGPVTPSIVRGCIESLIGPMS
jgi:hypothetical protein